MGTLWGRFGAGDENGDPAGTRGAGARRGDPVGTPRRPPPGTLLILMAQGAPGKPGRQVLKAETSEKGPRPQALSPATRNLYAVPGCSSWRFSCEWSGGAASSCGRGGDTGKGR